jgi:Domain of unknown function (DUF1772)
MIFGLFALMCAAAFSGAAIYVNAVEHPARAALDDANLLAQWKPTVRSGFLMLAPLAAAAGFCGFVAFFFDWDWKWILGAAVILANWPLTLYLIAPTEETLKDIESTHPDIRPLITRWAWAHGGRSALGVIATLLFLSAAI